MIMLQGSHLNHRGTTFYRARAGAAESFRVERHVLDLGRPDLWIRDRRLLRCQPHAAAGVAGRIESAGRPSDHGAAARSPDRNRNGRPRGLESMVTLAKEFFDMPRPVSGFAFVSIDNDWQPWLPPNEHPSHTPLKWLRLRSIEHDYREQRTVLRWQSECPAVGEPQEFRVHGAGQRTPVSYCVWHEGASHCSSGRSSLFEYANQSLRHPLVEGVNCSWSELIELAGDLLLEEEDLYPARYRTLGFPSAKQIAKLQE